MFILRGIPYILSRLIRKTKSTSGLLLYQWIFCLLLSENFSLKPPPVVTEICSPKYLKSIAPSKLETQLKILSELPVSLLIFLS